MYVTTIRGLASVPNSQRSRIEHGLKIRQVSYALVSHLSVLKMDLREVLKVPGKHLQEFVTLVSVLGICSILLLLLAQCCRCGAGFC